MSYRVTTTFDFDSKAEAEAALSDIEEAAGKHNGDLMDSSIEDLDETFSTGV